MATPKTIQILRKSANLPASAVTTQGRAGSVQEKVGLVTPNLPRPPQVPEVALYRVPELRSYFQQQQQWWESFVNALSGMVGESQVEGTASSLTALQQELAALKGQLGTVKPAVDAAALAAETAARQAGDTALVNNVTTLQQTDVWLQTQVNDLKNESNWYVHVQLAAQATWIVTHGRATMTPRVEVFVDSGGSAPYPVTAPWQPVDPNTVEVYHAAPHTGKVVVN